MAKVNTSIKTEPYRIEIKSPTGNVVIADEPIDKGGKEQRKRLLAVANASPVHKILGNPIEINTSL